VRRKNTFGQSASPIFDSSLLKRQIICLSKSSHEETSNYLRLLLFLPSSVIPSLKNQPEFFFSHLLTFPWHQTLAYQICKEIYHKKISISEGNLPNFLKPTGLGEWYLYPWREIHKTLEKKFHL
jgi:hypothetical protein